MASHSPDVRALRGWGGALRWLRCVVLVVGTLLVCSTMATAAGPRAGGPPAAVDAILTPAATASTRGCALQDAPAWPVGLPDGITNDVDDDDDDPTCGAAEGALLSFRLLAAPERAGVARRVALSVDTSRFAGSPGLPRGPPC